MKLIKYLIVALALTFYSTLSFAAGTATFNWTGPPANAIWEPLPDGSQPVVPPNWVIDEYRIKCVTTAPGRNDVVNQWSVPDYLSSTFSVSDLPSGSMSCQMFSYSVGAGTESKASNTVVKMIYDDAVPAAPAVFDFTTTVSGLPGPTDGSKIVVAQYTVTGEGYEALIECRVQNKQHGATSAKCKAISAEISNT